MIFYKREKKNLNARKIDENSKIKYDAKHYIK